MSDTKLATESVVFNGKNYQDVISLVGKQNFGKSRVAEDQGEMWNIDSLSWDEVPQGVIVRKDLRTGKISFS